MNWIDVLWPIVTGVCLTLALIHLGTGLKKPNNSSRRMVRPWPKHPRIYEITTWVWLGNIGRTL